MPAFKDRDIVSFYFDGEKKTGEILDVSSKSLLVCWVQKNNAGALRIKYLSFNQKISYSATVFK